MSRRLDVTLNNQTLPSIEFKAYISTDGVSTKENKAKKSLMELAVEEDQRMSARVRLGANRKPRVLCVNPWVNPNIEESIKFRKIKINEHTVPLTKSCWNKEIEKENSIQYLKTLLHRLDSPKGKMAEASRNNRVITREMEYSTRTPLNSGRVFESQKRHQDIWSIKQAELRLLFEPLSCLSSKPQTSKARNRCKSNGMSLGENKSPSTKRRKVSAAKILNFNSRIPEQKVKAKKRMSLFQLLE